MTITASTSLHANNLSREKILLAILPYWDPMIPPNGIAHLKSFLEKYDYNVKTVDIIVEDEFQRIYQLYSETVKQFVPESNRGNFLNIMHEVLQNHMMAQWNYDNEKDYFELIKILVFQSFYIHINNSQVRQLNEVLVEFYSKLHDYFIHLLVKEKPTVLGLTAYKGTLPASMFVLKLTREKYPHIKTVIGGGIFADTHAPGTPNFEILLEKTKEYLDKIIVGQGELLLLDFLQGKLPESQRVFTSTDINGRVLDFSERDIPDFSDFDLQRYPYLAATGSVSCPFQCRFCNSAIFWGKYRQKDVKQIVEEMITMYKNYGNQLFYMTDSLLNPIVTDLAREFIKSGVSLYYDTYFRVDNQSTLIENTLQWRMGGLYRVRLGTESGSQHVLDLMNKQITVQQIKDTVTALAYAGIKTTTYWVIGYPGETEKDFQKTLDLVEELRNSIFQAECNPFLYHFAGQFHSGQWEDKRMTLYPEETTKILIFKSWTLNIEPLREEVYRRIFRFSDHCQKLGIPNPYSLNEHIKADERWKKLHQNAAPAMLEFIRRGRYIDECKHIKLVSFSKNVRKDDDDFDF